MLPRDGGTPVRSETWADEEWAEDEVIFLNIKTKTDQSDL